MKSIEVKQNIESANGFKNWTLVFLTLCFITLVVDNYQRYGLIKDPLEITILVGNTIVNCWWLYGIIGLCIVQQAFQMYLVEKFLSLNIFSNKLGLILHAGNAFFSSVVVVVIARIYLLNPGVIRGAMMFVFFKIPKTWSFAHVNYSLRKQQIQDKNDDNKSTYPNNVTLRNVFTYFIFTPDIEYQPTPFYRTKPNWKGFFEKITIKFLLWCLLTFIVIQYINPELRSIKDAKWNYIPIFHSFLKIVVFFHIIWLLSYIVTYKLYHPAYADLMGMSYLKFNSDWWNSNNLMEFWRRWNLIVYACMKKNVVKPLLSQGYSKKAVEFLAFFIAGILHEILYTLPVGCRLGESVIGTILEVPYGKFSMYVSKKHGKDYGNFLMWVYLAMIHSCSLVHAYFNCNVHGLS